VTYSGITPPVTRANIHGPVSYIGATREKTAPIEVRTQGDFRSPFHGVAKIDPAQVKGLRDSLWYFSIRTKKVLAGEIRGPLVRK
jgi:hypothetical protein